MSRKTRERTVRILIIYVIPAVRVLMIALMLMVLLVLLVLAVIIARLVIATRNEKNRRRNRRWQLCCGAIRKPSARCQKVGRIMACTMGRSSGHIACSRDHTCGRNAIECELLLFLVALICKHWIGEALILDLSLSKNGTHFGVQKSDSLAKMGPILGSRKRTLPCSDSLKHWRIGPVFGPARRPRF